MLIVDAHKEIYKFTTVGYLWRDVHINNILQFLLISNILGSFDNLLLVLDESF